MVLQLFLVQTYGNHADSRRVHCFSVWGYAFIVSGEKIEGGNHA